jgi:hypothetical protein
LNTTELSLARQIDLVFKELEVELKTMSSGTVFIQIRNNVIGKFGIKHNPIAGRGGMLTTEEFGLTGEQFKTFRVMAIDALKFKHYWTHGEISYEFALRQEKIIVDAIIESNYNMASLMVQRYHGRKHTYNNDMTS